MMEHNTCASTAVKVEIPYNEGGSWPSGPTKMEGAKALAGVRPVDAATTPLSRASRAKNLSIEDQYVKAVLGYKILTAVTRKF
jgi:hypothetical protein